MGLRAKVHFVLIGAVACGATLLLDLPVVSSGSYVPPPPPRIEGAKVSKADLAKGKALLETKKKFSDKDMSCMTCHDKSAEFKFKRSGIKNAAKNFPAQINKCITTADRIGGKKLDPKDERIALIEAYLRSTFRVDD